MEPKSDNVAALCADGVQMCRAIALDDLADQACYIVPQSRLPGTLQVQRAAGGYTMPKLDLLLRDVIGDAWRGGFTCVVDDTWYPVEFDAAMRRRFLLQTVVQELAHALAEDYVYPASALEDDHEGRRFILQVMADVMAEPANFDVPVELPFQHHEDRWIRTAIHLLHRANRLGIDLDPVCVLNPIAYGTPWPYRFSIALGDECERLEDVRMSVVLATTPPAAFSELWADTVARHLGPERRNLSWDDGGPIRSMAQRLAALRRVELLAIGG